MIFALGSLFLEMQTRLQQELRALGPDLRVTPTADAPLTAATWQAVQKDLAHAGAEAVLPSLHGLARLDRGDAVITGTDLPALARLFPYWQLQGHWITVAFDDQHCLMGLRLAEQMELGLGDDVLVRVGSQSARLTIEGIFEAGTAADNQLFIALPLAQQLLHAPGEVHYLEARLGQGREISEQVMSDLQAAYPNAEVTLLTNLSRHEARIFAQTRGLMGIVIAMILLLTVLGVTITRLATMAERQKEMALMQALGAPFPRLNRLLTAEALLLGALSALAGSLLGLALAQVLGQTLFATAVRFSPSVFLGTLVLSCASAYVGSLWPLRLVHTLPTADLLRAA